MHETKLRSCPVCGGIMEFCFTNRASSLCYVSAAAVRRWAHYDQDVLNKGRGRFGKAIDGLRLILPSKAKYLLSYRCENCKLYTVDYGRVFSSDEAKAMSSMSSDEFRGQSSDRGVPPGGPGRDIILNY
jgi:hypothetical protein